MVLFGDFHTHTIYSGKNGHAKGTIEQNVKSASEKGLKAVAITEHGFNHRLYAVKRKDIQEIKTEIERLNAVYPVKTLMGIEANLISQNGVIDLTRDEQKQYDVILLGYHKMSKANTWKDRFDLFFQNDFRKIFNTKKVIQKNTDAYLRAIDKNEIDIIAHLNYGMPVDAVQIAKLAKEKGAYIELNGKRTFFPKDEIEKMIEMETLFVMNSDAHSPERVGEVNHPMNFAIMNNIPKQLIVNLNQLPDFKNHKG